MSSPKAEEKPHDLKQEEQDVKREDDTNEEVRATSILTRDGNAALTNPTVKNRRRSRP